MLLKTRHILSALFICSIIYTASAQTKLPTGVWRGALKNSAGGQLPFNFEVKDTAGAQQLAIINGDERYKVTAIKSKGDSVFIHMPLFDSEFKLKLDASGLSGNWIKHLGNSDAIMAFNAVPNTTWRFFKDPEKPAYDISGRWSAIFGGGDTRDTLVGEFKQSGAKLTGTFLSTSGDYRYLEGTVAGNQMYLSCFDGGHAYIFTAKINDDKTLSEGKQYSGFSGLDTWSAVKDANAKLPDAYSLTALKPGYKKIAFTFKDINGKEVSLSDARFKNKVVIVQILGSWCPNCMDETNYFVSSYYPKYHNKGVEVIGLAYERTTDFAKSQRTLQQMKTHFNVPYPLLITGFTPAAGDAQKSLPMLADFKGFPSTIIIDKKGEVRKIHTGFSGPGTGVYYTEFIDEFQKLTEDLLAEK
ncbi:peroxiredoxin family protein [Mucilaginibacter gotjawali]|uniref:Peroxiredoxin n=2 Tax=Mucilaginibacter gotjawali TaxID=1550579 RepID=A0A839SNA2_9SPHI|nr:TlpA disulfide reductase family protein [Mucilaginibacter gotjawali]MBB3057969.1 peroxiredoxin [Mucilaginibacter gotjawali]BAU52259.1 Thiol-disulfide oxidoreductase ResA [Mucilaginibacter gotjawali]